MVILFTITAAGAATFTSTTTATAATTTAAATEAFCLQVTRDLSLCDIWSVR